MSKHLTTKEDIALNLISEALGESFINRTPAEYEAIKAKLPPTKVLEGWVNSALAKIAAGGDPPYDICYFKAGDRHIWYEPFPKRLSIEVVRSALVRQVFESNKLGSAAPDNFCVVLPEIPRLVIPLLHRARNCSI